MSEDVPTGCDVCGFEGPTTEYDRSMRDGKKYLCELCADTIGQLYDYGPSHSILENAALKCQINYVANVILKAVKERA